MSNREITLADSERQPCEIWTRVMGYHRPVSEFNIGKRQEFEARRPFIEANVDGCCASNDQLPLFKEAAE